MELTLRAFNRMESLGSRTGPLCYSVDFVSLCLTPLRRPNTRDRNVADVLIPKGCALRLQHSVQSLTSLHDRWKSLQNSKAHR